MLKEYRGRKEVQLKVRNASMGFPVVFTCKVFVSCICFTAKYFIDLPVSGRILLDYNRANTSSSHFHSFETPSGYYILNSM